MNLINWYVTEVLVIILKVKEREHFALVLLFDRLLAVSNLGRADFFLVCAPVNAMRDCTKLSHRSHS
jgi:hypothetical protein